jgi:SAM-dependent methyltransferase
MGDAEAVIRITDEMAAFLHDLDTVMSTRLLPLLATFPPDPAQRDRIERLHAELFAQYRDEVTRFLDRSFAALTAHDARLSPQERRACLLYHRLRVQPFFLQTPFARRGLDKPLGYPGDFGLVEMLFANKADGVSPLARLLSHYMLNSGIAVAHRNRLPWVHVHLRRTCSRTPRLPRVLSFACGPENILRSFVRAGGICEITLCDFDPRALAHCRRQFARLARRAEGELPMHYVELSAYEVLKEPERIAVLRAIAGDDGYDTILVLGLLDYLPDAAVTAFLDALVPLLAEDGEILLTNVHASNPWRTLMEYEGDWGVIQRAVEQFAALAVGSPPRLTVAECAQDETGMNIFFAGHKCA